MAERGRSREAIRAAAARLFPERGYAGTSVRDIAESAGADPALVIRHFGSKEALFLEVMELRLEAQPFATGDVAGLGERFLASLLDSAEDIRGVFLALLRASDAGEINLRLHDVHERTFVAPLRARMTGQDADLRARLAAALVGGLLYALWVVGDDRLAAADHAELARRYGSLLQALITPDA
ncbi:MAG: TetR/AcrR family transcriptional regulator [Amnibacterium sp.]